MSYKVVRKGICLRCGNCCKHAFIMVRVAGAEENTERDKSFKQWLDNHSVPWRTNNDAIQIQVGLPCKHLLYREGMAVCDDYKNRPMICKEFPETQDNACSGFTFEVEEI